MTISLRMSIGLLALAAASPASAQTPPPPAAPPADITVTGRGADAFLPLVGGPDFISPMGEPFHSPDKLSGAEHWFAQADTNRSGGLNIDEFKADGNRFFHILDSDHDGTIGPQEIEHYEKDVVPEIHITSTYGDPSKATVDSDGKVTEAPYPLRLGAGRYGYLAIPEPVTYADTNLDRGITEREFEVAEEKRFKLLDLNGDGAITRNELPKLRPPGSNDRPPR